MTIHHLLHSVAIVLLIVGGLNWGLVGALGFDLVVALVGLVGVYPLVVKGIYISVGVAAIYELFCCRGKGCPSKK